MDKNTTLAWNWPCAQRKGPLISQLATRPRQGSTKRLSRALKPSLVRLRKVYASQVAACIKVL
eukprot:1159164-Pelagomonas_calceolata.AAC.1